MHYTHCSNYSSCHLSISRLHWFIFCTMAGLCVCCCALKGNLSFVPPWRIAPIFTLCSREKGKGVECAERKRRGRECNKGVSGFWNGLWNESILSLIEGLIFHDHLSSAVWSYKRSLIFITLSPSTLLFLCLPQSFSPFLVTGRVTDMLFSPVSPSLRAGTMEQTIESCSGSSWHNQRKGEGGRDTGLDETG